MKNFRNRPAVAIALAAALSLTATPAAARGWGHRHHDRGIDAGDVFAGLLVIGGIAAIASAASKKNRESREADYRYPDRRYPDARYPDRDPRPDESYREPVPDYGEDRGEPNYGYRPGNLDEAVDRCVSEVERGDRRVDSVEAVSRDGEGWRVEGRTDGRDFSCSVGGDGRIRGVEVDDRAAFD